MRKKQWGLTAALACLLVVGGGCGVRQIRDEVTVEAGQELDFSGQDFFEASGRELEKIVFDLTRVDAGRAGSYLAQAIIGKKRYDITVHVADRTPPMVELRGRVVFTDDLRAYDPMELIAGVYDASDYKVALARYAWEGELRETSDPGWDSLEALMLAPLNQEELGSLGSEEIPKKAGIYRGVLEVTDAFENVWREQLWIVLEPGESRRAVAKGPAPEEAEKRKGISSSKPAEPKEAADTEEPRDSGASETAGDPVEPPSRQPEDPDYYDSHLEEGQLAAIQAGYYQVVPDPRYGGYIVMVHGGEGSYGTQLIRAYLASIGCEAVGGSGDWISMDADQYAVYVTAEEVRPAGEGLESDWGELLWE